MLPFGVCVREHKMQIVLVEDDLMLGEALQETLMERSNHVDWVKDAESALKIIKNSVYDVMILDVGLPVMDGIELVKTLRRKQNNLPVLMLTARDTLDDKVIGLDAGADDYLLKPFDLDELLARLRALSRRSQGRASTEIVYGDLCVEPESQQVTYKKQLVTLTRLEYVLLLKLLENVGRILSREQLEQSLYGWTEDVESNALEVHIHHLRKKIATDLIHNVRGVGYMIKKPRLDVKNELDTEKKS
jgi:two-component system, OmpR family, response regulator QseB